MMDIDVKCDDSFSLYSEMFHVPFQLIMDGNRNGLCEGEKVRIPGYELINYRVKAGDTLTQLASQRQVSTEALLRLNPELDPVGCATDQTLKMPSRITNPSVSGKQKYDYKTMMNDLAKLKDQFPFIQIASIGNSVLGKDIPEILIGTGRKTVHVNGSFHANEWITTPVIMTFLNEYLLSLTNGTPVRGQELYPYYEQTTLSIVPMVNPDGVDLVLHGAPEVDKWQNYVLQLNNGSQDFSNWKANIRGVDLNNQFPANWDIEKARKPAAPAPRDYPGDIPLSEPETIAMAELTKQRDFARVLAFHTQEEVIFWGYENKEPPIAFEIVQEFARTSGYQPVQTIDSHAGYKDWFIQKWQRPGFTIELGEGINPLPLSQFDEIYEESLGIFLASLYM